jgi:hypothetical protein
MGQDTHKARGTSREEKKRGDEQGREGRETESDQKENGFEFLSDEAFLSFFSISRRVSSCLQLLSLSCSLLLSSAMYGPWDTDDETEMQSDNRGGGTGKDGGKKKKE